ncbi:MAG: SUMF1/EgtB/PvdO family nonheme iron enzyme [Nostoc sp.]|uniref:formylglycine-generating enzyme family protein n=1 Tax=Nostoc sp. TaxID=1180 RepID=UPI002FF9E2C1
MNSMLDMVIIPEGFFLMGADPEVEINAEYEEQPQREVWLSTYAIQRTPVTVGQWQEFLRNTGYDWSYDNETSSASARDFYSSLPNLAAEFSPGEMYPIVFVSWFDACQFTQWLKETLGGAYALPTEAQWEKACRGQNGQLYPWGNQEVDWLEEIALLYPDRNITNTKGSYPKTNQPVGCCLEKQSPYGCLDMWQNVSEWCSDWYDTTGQYYHDPNTNWVNPHGVTVEEFKKHRQTLGLSLSDVNMYSKVYRGGHLLSSGWPRCTYRGHQSPRSCGSDIGFRVVLNYQ